MTAPPPPSAAKVQAALHEATIHYQAGRLAEAEKICRRILLRVPHQSRNQYVACHRPQGSRQAGRRRAVVSTGRRTRAQCGCGAQRSGQHSTLTKTSSRTPRRPIGGPLRCSRTWSTPPRTSALSLSKEAARPKACRGSGATPNWPMAPPATSGARRRCRTKPSTIRSNATTSRPAAARRSFILTKAPA